MKAYEFVTRALSAGDGPALDAQIAAATDALQGAGYQIVEVSFAASEGKFAAMVPARRDRKGG